ncbi:MAG: phytanoyl-CoA dioxygenase [Planctomycetota bacterium]|nr:MAG: phytanoyl-CoA dioxygenase [Planctomycetota bacterium]
MNALMGLSTNVSRLQWNEYQENGFVKLGRTLDENELSQLQNRIDDYMMGSITNNELMMQLDVGGNDYGAMGSTKFGQSKGFKESTLSYRKIEKLEQDPLFFAFMRKEIFRDICFKTYGNIDISSYRAMFMNKPKDLGTVLPWHQDGGGSWGLSHDPRVTIWTALDHATTDNGCVQVIPGSHHLGLLNEMGHLITDEQRKNYCDESKVKYLELEAGESMILNNMLLHRSGVNNGNSSRRAFSTCYMDGSTTQINSGKRFPLLFEAK